MIEVRLLGPGDLDVLAAAGTDVFDHPVRPELAEAFLADPRHDLAVAIDGERVVGFATGVRYLHPDKPDELWVNEVGVAEGYRRRGVARRLLDALFERARAHGCAEAWVLTEAGNAPARGLYRSLGGEPQEDAVLYAFRLAAGGR